MENKFWKMRIVEFRVKNEMFERQFVLEEY